MELQFHPGTAINNIVKILHLTSKGSHIHTKHNICIHKRQKEETSLKHKHAVSPSPVFNVIRPGPL
jgi:hypothetical protein